VNAWVIAGSMSRRGEIVGRVLGVVRGVHPGAVHGGPQQLCRTEFGVPDVVEIGAGGEFGGGIGAPKQSELPWARLASS